MKITLRAARINAGLSQGEVAKAVGVNITTMSSWETGKTKPTTDKFRKMCELYDWPEECIRFEEAAR